MTGRYQAWPPLLLWLIASALCACGGGHPNSIPAVSSALKPAPAAAQFADLSLVIKVPSRSVPAANVRNPQFVSPAVRSVSVSVASGGSNAGTPMIANVNCGSGGCSATIVVLAPIGAQDTFTVIAYDKLNAAGNILSTAAVVYNVAAGGNVSVPIVLAGVVAAIQAVTVSNAHPLTGSVATSRVSVTAVDASGAIIAGNYAQPVSVQLFENDPDGVFTLSNSALTNAIPVALLRSSTDTATVSLNVKRNPDATTPDDATLVATVAGQSFVPNVSALPQLTAVGEITTACPPAGAECVYYPSGDEIIAAAPNILTQWDSGSAQSVVVAGSASDVTGAGATIWNLSATTGSDPMTGQPDGLLLNFNTASNAFGFTPAAGLYPATGVVDIGGTLWATGLQGHGGTESNPGPPATTGVFRLTTAGQFRGPFIADPLGYELALASALDSAGRFWVLQGAGSNIGGSSSAGAIDPATNAIVSCSFSGFDQTFVSAVGVSISVAGSTVWAAFEPFEAQFGGVVGYVVKIPSTLGAGCAPGALTGLPAFLPTSANPSVGPGTIGGTLVDSSGDVFALEPTVVTKISTAGTMTNFVDLGALTNSSALSQSYVAFALDPAQANLYLLDDTSGTLDRTSSVAPAAGTPLSLALPPVLAAAVSSSSTSTGSGISFAHLFFEPDGSLWIANVSFNNPAALFRILGSVGSVNYGGNGSQLSAASSGLVRINLANAAFVQSAARHVRSIAAIRALAAARLQRSLRRNLGATPFRAHH